MIMWRKHRKILQYHVNYIHNEIVNPFRVGILQYYERIGEMHDLAKNIPLPSMTGQDYDEANWVVRDK